MYIPPDLKGKVMEGGKMVAYIKNVIENIPSDWLKLTTHRLDIYEEKLAKTQFLEQFETLYHQDNSDLVSLNKLPTAFDYIRLGHPLSCILEWAIAKVNQIKSNNVISFSSKTIPILAILRKNLLDQKSTQILYKGELPRYFDVKVIRDIYNYDFELINIDSLENYIPFKGSIIYISQEDKISDFKLPSQLNDISIDFLINIHSCSGSIVMINGEKNQDYISKIQHVRRRETIAMTPDNCLAALKVIIQDSTSIKKKSIDLYNTQFLKTIKEVTGTKTKALLASSGLSIQYAITMGLIHYAHENHNGKKIKIIVPSNCYGGTNDQARRVAACLDHVEILDLLVDGDHEMVESLDILLEKIAQEDAIPFIIAEIPTNPRVEVPDLLLLEETLSRVRKTNSGKTAIDPVFILDQTFCPNLSFLSEDDILSKVQTVAYISGSKFPSGGLCNAGFCLVNKEARILLDKIELHLLLCDNVATNYQIEILSQQFPSMHQRINDAYKNTRSFVNFIQEILPESKINFVSEELAEKGFTPSVFSLDLPTKGKTKEERESYKRDLNHKLISLMIQEIPNESKHCVSYGQLKGCYWTIPATSTQGTTKEADKDYIVRVALSPNMDIELHKKVFAQFVDTYV